MLQFRLNKLLGMSIKLCGDKGHQFDPRNKMRRFKEGDSDIFGFVPYLAYSEIGPSVIGRKLNC